MREGAAGETRRERGTEEVRGKNVAHSFRDSQTKICPSEETRHKEPDAVESQDYRDKQKTAKNT